MNERGLHPPLVVASLFFHGIANGQVRPFVLSRKGRFTAVRARTAAVFRREMRFFAACRSRSAPSLRMRSAISNSIIRSTAPQHSMAARAGDEKSNDRNHHEKLDQQEPAGRQKHPDE